MVLPAHSAVGQVFNYGDIYTIRLDYAGNEINGVGGAADITNLTINGVTMGAGTYNSGFTNNFMYFRYSDGTPFTKNFTIAGDFMFTGSFNGDTPRRLMKKHSN